MPPYRRRPFVKKRYARSRSSARRPMGSSFMKRARTRAYANIRTGGLLAIERKFSDFAATAVGMSPGGNGVATGFSSTFSPPVISPNVYRSAVGIITGALSPGALNALGPGDTGSDRDGRQVINDSIHLRGSCQISAVLAGGLVSGLGWCPVINVVLVLDTQTNGGVPAGSAVFVNPGDFTSSGETTGGNPFVNLSNSKRFRILKHIRRVIEPQCAYLDATPLVQTRAAFNWSMDVPLKAMKTNYVADPTPPAMTSGSIGDNGIFLFAWSNNPVNACSITFNSRLRFRG